MSIKNNKKQIILSIIVGIAVAVVSYQMIFKLKVENENLKRVAKMSMNAPANSMVYVVLKEDIKKGEKITKEKVSTRHFPMIIEGAIADVHMVEGLAVKKDIKKNTPLFEDSFEKGELFDMSGEPRLGYRAVGVKMKKSAIPPYVEQGEFVDLYSEKDTVRAKNIRVLKILDMSSGNDKYVMLEIAERNVPALISAMAQDNVVFVQRNKLDSRNYYFASISGGTQGMGMYAIPDEELAQMTEIPEIYDTRQISGEGQIKQFKNVNNEIEIISGNKKVIVGAQ